MQLFSGLNNLINSYYLHNSKGDSRTVMKTANGGATWTSLTGLPTEITASASFSFHAVSAVSATGTTFYFHRRRSSQYYSL